MKLKLIITSLVILLLAAVVFFRRGTISIKWLEKKPVFAPIPTIALPTKTPEEIEIISKIEEHKVIIYDKNIKPKVLNIKAHDQVSFVNKTNKEISVAGEGWGGVLLRPEENMTQSFEKIGSFEYKVSTSLLLFGEVIVR